MESEIIGGIVLVSIGSVGLIILAVAYLRARATAHPRPVEQSRSLEVRQFIWDEEWHWWLQWEGLPPLILRDGEIGILRIALERAVKQDRPVDSPPPWLE